METKPWHHYYDACVRPDMRFPEGCLYDLFAAAAAKQPDKTAAVFLDAEYSYRTLWEWTDAFACALYDQGVRKGDRVILSLPNCPQFIPAFYGLLRLGAVCVMLNPLSTEPEIDFKCRNSGAKGMIALDMFYDKFHAARIRNNLEFLVFSNIFDTHPVFRSAQPAQRDADELDMRRMLEYDRRDLPAFGVSPTDPAVLIYSGGTTGEPKGVMESHRNQISNAWVIAGWLPLKLEDRGLAVLPFFHGFGMQTMLNAAYLNGASLVIMPQFDIKQLFENIQRYRCTFFVGVPTLYVAMNTYPENRQYDISSLRAAVCGGAPLPLSVKHEFERLTGGSLVEGYGLTESTCAVCCNPIHGLNKEGSIGIPMPGSELKIVDLDTGNVELEPGEVGEIVIKSPTVMMGYWNNPAETAQTIRDGWLYTGDIGKMDTDGFFYIVDRKKEMIIAGGFNIYPKEVEEIIQSHPAVLETAVIGLPDPYRGETVKAYIVVRAGMTLAADEIEGYCREKMLKYMVPKLFEFRDSLPKSQIGKIMKKELKAAEIAKMKEAAQDA